MPLQARRIFRLSLTLGLSLACAYALQIPLPFITPVFALLLSLVPAPPLGAKGLVGLVAVVLVTTGAGLLLVPLLLNYPVSAVMIVALGLFISNYLTVNLAKGLVGALLTVGIAMISAAGTASYALALTVIEALVTGIVVTIVCQWLVYPWFPEDGLPQDNSPRERGGGQQSNWIALRATLIVLPAYLLALTNPAMYLATIMKSVSLGQQSSIVSARDAGTELLGSTFLAGCCAILFWFLLGAFPSLWMFFLWTLLFGVFFASKIYRVIPSRFSSSFWQNVAVTMLILLGPAVEDSANGKDVYMAFASRMGLFTAVTLYAWLAIYLLERLRTRFFVRINSIQPEAD
ncbi:MAG: DUF2955 domain-containing protein [Gammaproteobacteria bacterium]|nr:DUF2955 domain-containing protein [Gammaproteobacteria bacterium]